MLKYWLNTKYANFVGEKSTMKNTISDYNDEPDQNSLQTNPVELARLQQRIAELEGENSRLRQYFSLPSEAFKATSPTKPPKSNEEIQAEHYRFYQILINSNAGIVVQTGPEHTFQFANPIYERLVGRGSERLLGVSVREAFPELEGQGLYELMDEVIRSGQPFTAKEMPVQLNRQDNNQEEVFFTFTYYPLLSLEGDVEGFFTYALDVTEEVKTRQALELERHRLKQLFEDTPAVISITRGPNHVIELANARYLQLVGRPASVIVGRPAIEVFPEVIAQGFIDLQDRIYQSGQPFVGQETRLLLDLSGKESGELTELFMNFVFQPIFAADGSGVEGIFAFWVDVTEQVKSRQEIERLSRLKDDFLASASHDLRTPITTIKGYIQLLERSIIKYQQTRTSRLEVDEGVRESEGRFLGNSLQLIATALNQVNRLNDLVDRLLDFSQIAEGRLRLQYSEQVDLLGLVVEVVSALSLTSTKHQILMQPLVEANIVVSCDAVRLEQVLNNLIGNAIKYSPNNTTITVGLEPAHQATDQNQAEVVIWVRDEGYGVSPDQQSRLFERFYRVENEQNSSKGGLGLGLYISAEIIKQHGGRLWVESKVGQGSTFYLALPVRRPL